jgi:uncharacterized protein YoxC
MTSVFADIAAIAQAIIALALVVIAALVIPVAWGLRRVHRRINTVVDRLHGEVSPVIQHARSIADDVHYVTRSVRDDMARVNETIANANERVEHAVALAEQRLNEFNALLAVVQEEAESLFVSTASAVRGVRGGAAAFREDGLEDDFEHDFDDDEEGPPEPSRRDPPRGGRSGIDFASDELDAAATANEIETQEEHRNVNDSRSEPTAAPLAVPLPLAVAGAPRVRPRAGRSHRA